jgi:hypothetical protein
MSRIYVASSWRNQHQPGVVAALRTAGHDVYDFRNPSTGGPPTSGVLDGGFHWSDIDPAWQGWDAADYRAKVTTHPLACAGFDQDLGGIEWADTCVLVLPAGRSAHLEAGWARGAGKRLVILLLGELEPELMYRWAHDIVLGVDELVEVLACDVALSTSSS